MQLLVDPILLALPDSRSSKNKCLDFFDRLSYWSQVYTENKDIFVSESCYLSLIEGGYYPQISNFSRLIASRNIESVDCYTVFNACQSILCNLPYLEERLAVPDQIYIDIDAVEVTPVGLLQRLPDTLMPPFKETLGYIAYAREILHCEIACEISLATVPYSRCKKLKIAATVEIAGKNNKITTTLPIVGDPRALLQPSLPPEVPAVEKIPPRLTQHDWGNARSIVLGFMNKLLSCPYVRHCRTHYWNQDLSRIIEFRLARGEIEAVFSNGTWTAKIIIDTSATTMEQKQACIADLKLRLRDWGI